MVFSVLAPGLVVGAFLSSAFLQVVEGSSGSTTSDSPVTSTTSKVNHLHSPVTSTTSEDMVQIVSNTHTIAATQTTATNTKFVAHSSGWSCDQSVNMIFGGADYTFQSLMDPNGGDNRVYGVTNDHEKAVAYCKRKCESGTGPYSRNCVGFFYQVHGQRFGHEICGFYHTEPAWGEAVWHAWYQAGSRICKKLFKHLSTASTRVTSTTSKVNQLHSSVTSTTSKFMVATPGDAPVCREDRSQRRRRNHNTKHCHNIVIASIGESYLVSRGRRDYDGYLSHEYAEISLTGPGIITLEFLSLDNISSFASLWILGSTKTKLGSSVTVPAGTHPTAIKWKTMERNDGYVQLKESKHGWAIKFKPDRPPFPIASTSGVTSTTAEKHSSTGITSVTSTTSKAMVLSASSMPGLTSTPIEQLDAPTTTSTVAAEGKPGTASVIRTGESTPTATSTTPMDKSEPKASSVGQPGELEANSPAVLLVLKVRNIDYAQLASDASLLKSFRVYVKNGILQQCGDSIAAEDISLNLYAGSVMIEATIRLPEATAGEELQSKLSSPAQTDVIGNITAYIKSVPNINSIATGPILLDVTSVEQLKVPEPQSMKRSPVHGLTTKDSTTTLDPDAEVASTASFSFRAHMLVKAMLLGFVAFLPGQA